MIEEVLDNLKLIEKEERFVAYSGDRGFKFVWSHNLEDFNVLIKIKLALYELLSNDESASELKSKLGELGYTMRFVGESMIGNHASLYTPKGIITFIYNNTPELLTV